MDAKALQRQLFGYFQSLGFYEYKNGFLKGDCPECGSEDKCGVNLERNFIHCFKCELATKPLKLIMRTNGMDKWSQVFEFLGRYDSTDYIAPKSEPVPERTVILPSGFKLLKYGEGHMGRRARNYMKGRGFNIKDLSRKGVGYVGDIEQDYYGYIIFPFYKDRRIIYFQTRLFFGNGAKFKNPKYEDYGIGKNQVIYNIGALNQFNEVSILESATNCLTLGNRTVGLNGKKASQWQLTQLLESRVKLFNVILDKDALEYAVQLASDLVLYKKVRVIQFEDDRDVNDLGKEITVRKIKDTKICDSINDIMKLKWSLSKRQKQN